MLEFTAEEGRIWIEQYCDHVKAVKELPLTKAEAKMILLADSTKLSRNM